MDWPRWLHDRAERGADACWRWRGPLDAAGYGRFRGGYAHRRTWEQFRGTIPPGQVLHHLCVVRSCVNPAHLQIQPRGAHSAGHQRRRWPLEERVARRRAARRRAQQRWKTRQRLLGLCRVCREPGLVVTGRWGRQDRQLGLCARHRKRESVLKRLAYWRRRASMGPESSAPPS